jgi:homoserine O-acetyltransferase
MLLEDKQSCLALAREIAHITYTSQERLDARFNRSIQDANEPRLTFGIDFAVESYMLYQGASFVDRFDANSYLYITRAMDYYDLERDAQGYLPDAFRNPHLSYTLTSFTTDWLFPATEHRLLAAALRKGGAHVEYSNIESPHGHDAFLIDNEQLKTQVFNFLARLAALYV